MSEVTYSSLNMSREEMLEILRNMVFGSFGRLSATERQALDMAIKELESVRVVNTLISEDETVPNLIKYIMENAAN